MDFEEQIRDRLRAMGVDITPNNFIDDLFTKTYLRLNEPQQREMAEIRDKLKFKNFDDLSFGDLEMFAGNFFVEPEDGKKATGTVRIYYSEPRDSFIPEGTTFSTGDYDFYAVRDQEITSDNMLDYNEGIYYYHEISIEAAEEGIEYLVGSGEITEIKNPAISTLTEKVENKYPTQGASNPETPENLYNRIPDSLAGKNFVNDPAISSILRDNFTFVELYTVRTGHEFMDRDIVTINGEDYRVGNKFDMWINSGTFQERTKVVEKTEIDPIFNFGFSMSDFLNTDSTYACETIDGPLEEVVLMITDVRYIGEAGEQSTPVEYNFTQKEGHAWSTHQESTIEITDTEWNDVIGQIEITYLTSPIIHEMQYFALDKENRLPVGDPLIRHFELIPLTGIIEYKGEDAVDEEEMTDLVNEFVKTYDYDTDGLTKVFELSDIVDHMYRFGFASKVIFPLELEADITIQDEYELMRYQTLDPYIATSKV